MQVRVLYFGILKELLKTQEEVIELPASASVATLLQAVRTAQPERVWELTSLAVAVNREYANVDQALHEGDEVALLPPVSGGAGDAGPSTSLRSAQDDTSSSKGGTGRAR